MVLNSDKSVIPLPNMHLQKIVSFDKALTD